MFQEQSVVIPIAKPSEEAFACIVRIVQLPAVFCIGCVSSCYIKFFHIERWWHCYWGRCLWISRKLITFFLIILTCVRWSSYSFRYAGLEAGCVLLAFTSFAIWWIFMVSFNLHFLITSIACLFNRSYLDFLWNSSSFFEWVLTVQCYCFYSLRPSRSFICFPRTFTNNSIDLSSGF